MTEPVMQETKPFFTSLTFWGVMVTIAAVIAKKVWNLEVATETQEETAKFVADMAALVVGPGMVGTAVAHAGPSASGPTSTSSTCSAMTTTRKNPISTIRDPDQPTSARRRPEQQPE